MHHQVLCTRKKMMYLGSRLIACCKLAPTLARQMWRHNYVIDRNEYLIFTSLESTNPWVYSLQFLFKSTNNSWIYERKCEWVFFSEHSVHTWRIKQARNILDCDQSNYSSRIILSRIPEIGLYSFEIFQDDVRPPLGFGSTGSISIQYANRENYISTKHVDSALFAIRKLSQLKPAIFTRATLC